MNVGSAVSSRLALQRFFARTDSVTSKTSISRRSSPGSAPPFKGSLPDRLVFTLSTLSTRQAVKRYGSIVIYDSKRMVGKELAGSRSREHAHALAKKASVELEGLSRATVRK